MESNSTTSDTGRLVTKESKNVSIVTTNEDISVIFLEMCTELKLISKKIAELDRSLGNTNELLVQVKALNVKQAQDDAHTKAIEELVQFIKKETTQIDYRKDVINKAVGEVDSRLEDSFRLLTKHANDNINEFQKALGKQQDALQEKLNETQTIVEELRNLASLKDTLMKLEESISYQNVSIHGMLEKVKLLTDAKNRIGMINVKISKGLKLVLICSILLILIACLFFIYNNIFGYVK